ncbi:MAG: tetratricopeptide repeat protein [Candidatus Zixiibacteriota bacterium]
MSQCSATLLVGFTLCFLCNCGQDPKTVEQLQQAGEEAFVNQDYAKARSYLLQAVAKKPSDPQLLYLLGISYQRDYLYDSAFYYLKRAAILYPDDRETNLALYEVAKALGDWKSAIKAIHVLIKTGDASEQYDRELAELNLRNENYHVAYHFYRKLLEREPDNPNHYLIVANLAISLDSVDAALRVIDSAIGQFGQREELQLNKGMYLIAAGKYQESEAIFRSLLAQDSTSTAYKLNLANALASQDSKAKKEEAYQLYQDIKEKVGPKFKVDSLLQALKEELHEESQ